MTKEKLLEHLEGFKAELEDYDQYRNEYGQGKAGESIANIIEDLDIDSIEFNAGFEQGWLKCLKFLIRLSE